MRKPVVHPVPPDASDEDFEKIADALLDQLLADHEGD